MLEPELESFFAGPGPDEVYHQHLAEGRFMLQRDMATGDFVFYPRAVSPHSRTPRLEWVAASGRGEVYATTVVRNRPEQGGPINVALIALAEGPRIMSRVEGIPATDVRIGMKVQADIIQQDGGPLLVFRRAED